MAAITIIRANPGEPFISAALHDLQQLLLSAGAAIPVTRLYGLPPRRRSRVALARLRERGIQAERLLANVFAVNALVKREPEKTHRVEDWKTVAIAKAAHRLASGHHKVWEAKDESGAVAMRTELHAYPRSSGRVLRHLGEAISTPCGLAVEKHLDAIVAAVPTNT